MCLDSRQFETVMLTKNIKLEDFRNEHNLISNQHDVFVEKDWKKLEKRDQRNVEQTGMILMDKVKKKVCYLRDCVNFCPL